MSCYRRDLWAFLRFLAQHCGALPSLATLRDLGRPDLRAYLKDRYNRQLVPSSTARALAVIRSFFRFLTRHDLVNNPAVAALRNPKVPQSIPKALSRQDAFDALEGAEYLSRSSQLLEHRSWVGASVTPASLTLLYGCGLRLGEALALKRSDLHAIRRGQLVINGKGNKQRMAPVLETVAEVVQEYVAACPYSDDPLFLGSRRTPPSSHSAGHGGSGPCTASAIVRQTG